MGRPLASHSEIPAANQIPVQVNTGSLNKAFLMPFTVDICTYLPLNLTAW